MRVTYQLRLNKAWRQTVTGSLRAGLDSFSRSILSQAVRNAPKLTGALRASGRVAATSQNERVISFGNSSVPYAVRRHFENYRNPHTKYYLQRAGETAAARYAAYFQRIS